MAVTKRKQHGAGVFPVILLLVAGGFLVSVGLRLIPVYIENYKVKTALESLHNEAGLLNAPQVMVKRQVLRHLDVDDVRNVKERNIEVKRSPSGLAVSIKYEVRVHLLGNIDAVASFSEKTKVASR